MPQPVAVDATADELVRVFIQAQEAIDARWQEVLDDPRRWRERRRLNELRAAIAQELAAVDTASRLWVATRLPFVYELGAEAAGLGSFEWALPHRDALSQVASETFGELLQATRYVSDDVKAKVRLLGKGATEQSLAQGTPAKAASRKLERVLAQDGLKSVTYANGAQHSMREYAEVVLRTRTAVAYNAGTVVQGSRFGVTWWEVFDGAGCGWTSHDSTDTANGSIRSTEEVSQFPISHPNCRRSFGPRPDLSSRTQAEQASPTPQTIESPARATIPRPTMAPERASSGRQPRSPRSPRSKR